MHPQRSYSSSPSDDGAHYDSSPGSTHSQPGPQPHLYTENAPTSPRDGYALHSGYPAMNGTLDGNLRPHPNRDARQHRSDWTAQDPSRYPPSYSQQPNSSYISYTDTTFPGAAQALPFAYLLPQDGSLEPRYDTLASSHIYNSSPAYPPAPRTYHAHEATPSTFVDYALAASYGQPIRAPYPTGSTSPDVSRLSYVPPMPPNRTQYPDHIHKPALPMCEWDGCNQPLGDNTCAGVRRHLRDHHYKGKPPSAKDPVQCKWGGSCRRDPMQWENIPKHISECHTKTMTRVCALCGDTFARSDTLKRHKEAGNCSRSSLR
ncbi:hypothetical protein VTO73DRAFT_3753 [Trametes versicolor]